MKFRDISERVKGGKLDPLSKMGKSKLTGQEIAKYYKDNPKAKQAARDKTVKKAIELALDLGGAQSYAIKEIEKLKRGLSKMPVVQQALRTANEEMTSTSSVAMPEIPLGRKHKVMKRKELEEASMTYRIRKAQKPEIDNMMKGARMMKLKVTGNRVKTVGADPRRKTGDTEITVSGTAKNLRDFDAVVRGKSSYGDPSLVKEDFDLLEKQFAIKPDMDYTAPFSPKYRKKFRKSAPGSIKNKEEIVAMIRKKKDGKHKIKDGNTSLIVRSLARMMNQDRKGARDKGAAFGKGDPKDEMDAPKIKKMIDIVSKGITVTKKGNKITRNAPEINAFTNVDTAVRDDVYQVINMASDGTLSSLVYNESTELDESVKLSRPAKGQRTITIDFSKARNPKKAKDKTMSIAKKHGIKTGKPKKPQSKDDVEFTGSKKAMTLFGREFNLAGRTGLLENKESFNLNEESATMKKVRQVIKKKGMMNIDGMKLDLTTASMIASVYDQVNPMNKKRMDKLKLPQLVNLTMKVAGKGKIKKEDAVERAKELADLKAKHKREVEQEKDEIAATKQTNESLWRNIHNKRKSGKKMRKPGEKGAPTAQDFKNARGESVSEAPQSKKFQMTFTDKQPKSLDHFLRMIKTQERATASSGIPTIKLLKKTKKGKNTVVDFMSGPNMQIKSIKDIMYNVKKKFKELEEAVSPNQKAILQRVKERFPRLGKAEQEKIAKIVKPKGQIDSTLYLALGNAYDKRDLKALKTLMTNYGKKYKIEAVSPAQQAAIAISKKERGEKPKNECADEKDFKPHKMYKGDKEVMANTYADHVKYDKMGYSHEKPKKEALDAKDKPFVKDLVKKLRGGSKTHAKQADDLEKAMNTESMSRAKRDAMRDMGTRKDRDDDGNPVATADDRKAADKNVVMQIRRVTDLSKPAQIELRNGKKVMLKPADAKMMMKKFDAIRKPQDRLKVQNAMNDKKMTVQGLKRLLGK